MKIAFDAKRISHNATGLGNYSRYIVNILSNYYPEHQYQLYFPSKGKSSLRAQLPAKQQIKDFYPKGLHSVLCFKSMWRSFGIVRDLKQNSPDLFHGLSNEIPLGLRKAGIKSIVTIHDLIFMRYPLFYPWIDRHIYAYKFKKSCQEANKIIAISEMTKRDIISYFHIPEEKIKVIYQGCDKSFTQAVSADKKAEVRRKYNFPEQYILYVGSIESRKNLLLVVKALGLLKEKVHLVAIGKQTPYTEVVKKHIEELHLEEQVSILSNIPFDELPAIYQMASLFTYPSFFEGFGIPIIEALHSGVPVIAATGSCLEEAGGPYSIYVDPNNEMEMSEAISKVLSDKDLADKMIKQGKEYVNQFNEKIAKDIIDLYNQVINE